VKRFFIEVWLPAMRRNWEFIQQNILPILSDLAQWLSNNLPVAIKALKGFWENVLLPALEAVWSFIQNDLNPILNTLHEWLLTNIPVAIKALKTFWEETLLPAIKTVWKFIQDNLIPLFNTLVAWLQENIPAAITALKGFWEETLLPAIQAVWQFIQDDLIPLFQTLVEWLQANIPPAIEAVRSAWEDTLLPALQAVWGFISESLWPLFKALVDWWKAVFEVALTALAGLWENVLLPALTAVWSFIQEKVVPIFEVVLAQAIEQAKENFNKFSTVVSTIAGVLKTVLVWALNAATTAFNGIKSAIGWVIEKVNAFASAIRSLKDKLPDWLKPGSASLLELALLGIGGAIKLVVVNVGELISDLRHLGTSTGETLGRIFNLASAIGSLGETAAEQWMDPLKEDMDAINSAIEEQKKKLKDTTLPLEERRRLTQELYKLEAEGAKAAAKLEHPHIGVVHEIDEAQADLQYLQQQIKLLDLIKQYKLKPEHILGGLKLGVDAEARDVVGAMKRAMQTIVAATQKELEAGELAVPEVDIGLEAIPFPPILEPILLAVDAIKKFTDAIKAIPDKLPSWLQPKSQSPFEFALLGITDAALFLANVGLRRLLYAIRDIKNDIVDAGESMLSLGATMGALGMAAGERWAEPIREQVSALDEQIEAIREELAKGVESVRATELMRRLYLLEEKRAIAANELLKAEEAITALRKKQADIQFLQQQLQLLKLIKEHELAPREVLGGLKLGLEANLPDIVEAMGRAMEKILTAAQEELGIGSPSKVFARMGAEAMAGFIAGFTGGVGDFPNVTRLVGADGGNYDNRTTYNFNQTVNTRATRANVMRDFEFARALYA